MRAKKIIAFVIALTVVLGGISYSGTTTKPVEAATEWDLVWSDEFNGTALDRNNWNVEVNGNGGGNNELQYYCDNEKNIKVSDGSLKITALKENYNGKKYTSGRITTQNKHSFKYGRVEARIKLPCFNGIWPAFWMLGDTINGQGWPKCGEIDIMEAINAENKIYGTVHWSYQNNHAEAGGNLPNIDRTQWHVYAIEWTSTQIKWYCDDVNFYTQNIADEAEMQEFRAKHFIIFNVAVGGNWPGFTIDDSYFPNNSTMEVDYVRVYQEKEEPTTPYDGPMITVTQDAVAEYTGQWTTFFGKGWCGTSGTAQTSSSFTDGYTMNLTSIGNGNDADAVWSAQCNLENIKYYPGATYTYKCTILSDVDKAVWVKVADVNEDAMAGELIQVKAGEPYEYETTFTIPEDYEDKVSLKFGMGKANGEDIDSNIPATIKVSDLSFVTTVEIPDPEYVQPTTTPAPATPNQGSANKPTTVAPSDVTNQTTATPSNATTLTPGEETTTFDIATMKKPRKVTLKKSKKKLAAKKVTVEYKAVKGATGYEIAIYKSKKKANSDQNAEKAIVTKDVTEISTIVKSKKLKNKKKLFIKARAYVQVTPEIRVHGKWSKIKKVKIKK